MTITEARGDVIVEAMLAAQFIPVTLTEVRAYGDETADAAEAELDAVFAEVKNGLRCDECGSRGVSQGSTCEDCKISNGDCDD